MRKNSKNGKCWVDKNNAEKSLNYYQVCVMFGDRPGKELKKARAFLLKHFRGELLECPACEGIYSVTAPHEHFHMMNNQKTESTASQKDIAMEDI